MKHIVFTGLRGSGKTTQARRLANILSDAERITECTMHQLLTCNATDVLKGTEEVLIIDETWAIQEALDYMEGIFNYKNWKMPFMIFCAAEESVELCSEKFRVIKCEYLPIRQEYIIEYVKTAPSVDGTPEQNLKKLKAVWGQIGRSTELK